MNRSPLVGLLLDFGVLFLLLILGYTAGTLAEKRHYRSIRRRERELRNILIFAVRTPPASLASHRSMLVCGSVVIGMDYFKRTLAYLRNIVGGRVGSYETLFERARREAVLRLKEQARALNATHILNIKFSTANIMNVDLKSSGCVEVIAYGTALIPPKREETVQTIDQRHVW